MAWLEWKQQLQDLVTFFVCVESFILDSFFAKLGRTSDDFSDTSDYLNYIQAKIMSNLVCSATFNDVVVSHICLEGTGRRSACLG